MTTTLELKDYRAEAHPDWCPGCGDFGILRALQMSFVQLQLPPHEVVAMSGIGCSAKTPHYLRTYGFHTLHGRVLPVATGVKLANPRLTVIAMGGDGDGYGIGGGHFVATGRRNLDMTYIVMNNGVYGLTKGQASPTLGKGVKTKALPEAPLVDSINPLALALASGYSFIARGLASDTKHLQALVVQAIQHKGMSLIDVLQECPTYNDIHTVKFFNGKDREVPTPRVYKLEDTDYVAKVQDPSDPDEVVAKKAQAMIKAYEWGDRIPLGVFYQMERPTYVDEISAHIEALNEHTPVELSSHGRDVSKLIEAMA